MGLSEICLMERDQRGFYVSCHSLLLPCCLAHARCASESARAGRHDVTCFIDASNSLRTYLFYNTIFYCFADLFDDYFN